MAYYYQNSRLIWQISKLLGLYFQSSDIWCRFLQLTITCLNLISIFGRLIGDSEGVANFQNAREILPLLYNLLVLLMSASYFYLVSTSLCQVKCIFAEIKLIDSLLPGKPKKDWTWSVSIGQCVMAVMVSPLAIIHSLISLQNSSLPAALADGVGHTLCLLGGSFLEQQFNSCMLATRARFKKVNAGLGRAKKVFQEGPMGKRLPATDFASEIRRLRMAHFKICKLFHLIGDTFQIAVLMQVIYTFLAVLSLLFFIVSSALSPNPGGGTWQVLALLIASLWLSLLTLRLVVTSWSVDNTIKHAWMSGSVLQKLQHKNLNSLVALEVSEFSNQLLQNDLALSICGLFKLDMTVLHSIAGTATTYLVILIQFQSPST